MNQNGRQRLFGQFQWPIGIAILYVIFKACDFKPLEVDGILEKTWDFLLINVVDVFMEVTPFLFLLTMLEALISPMLMGFWNGRLSSKVRLLQDAGSHDEACALANRVMTWPVLLRTYIAFIGLTLAISAVGYIYQKLTASQASVVAADLADKKPGADVSVVQNSNADNPDNQNSGAKAQSGKEGVGTWPVPKSRSLFEGFLWSLSIVGVLFLIDWFTSFISFLFGFENRDVAYLETVRKN